MRPPNLSSQELYSTVPDPDAAARRKAFQAAFRKVAGPWLQEQGFTASGANHRRFPAPAVHVINLQPWKHGGGVAVNLGIHFSFLPLFHNPPPWEKLEEPWCALRWRLSPEGGGDFWWRHGADSTETTHAVEHLLHTLRSRGAAWFDAFGVLPGAYADLDEKALPALQGRFLAGPPVLALAHILAHAGHAMRARALLDHEGKRAVESNPAHRERLEQATRAVEALLNR